MKPAISKPLLWAVVLAAQLPMLSVYLLRLAQDPIYGFLPGCLLLVTGLLIGLNWDRRWELPRRPVPLLGAAVGLLAGLLAAIAGYDWLAGFGFWCTAGAWLATHHQADGQRLLPVWYVLWGLLRLPLGANASLTHSLASEVKHGLESLLRLQQIPHVSFDAAIEVLAGRLYVDQFVYSILGWPLFVAVAMLHSALWCRPWLVAAMNVPSAIVWCFVFHLGWMWATLRFSLLQESGPPSWLGVLWGVGAYALFVSAERGIRVLLWPISDSSLDARLINPFVRGWNSIVVQGSRRGKSWRLAEHWLSPRASWGLVSGMVLMLLLQLWQAPRAVAEVALTNAGLEPGSLQEFVFQKAQLYDYRRSYFNPPLIAGRATDVWTVYAPLVTSEHAIDVHLRPVTQILQSAEAGGWEVEAEELVPTTLPDGQALTYGSAGLKHGRRVAHVYYAWLGADGTPIDPAAADSRGYLLVSWADLVPIHAAAARRDLLTEFSRLVVAARNQLRASTADREAAADTTRSPGPEQTLPETATQRHE